jgi:hypothetical protein
MFVGLVRDPGWHGPPDGLPDKPERQPRAWRVPWGPLMWVATLLAMVALVPLADHLIGNLAGYVMILTVVLIGALRVEYWCSRQYWRGLRDYPAKFD